ncbi:hypothetical protein BH10ACT11_BH10ACT11_20780 [soil metagenome]
MLDLATARISEIVAATERATSEIQAKAAETMEAQGEGLSSPKDDLVASLNASLVERAGGLGQQASELSMLLSRARAQLGPSAPTSPPAGPSVPSEPMDTFGSTPPPPPAGSGTPASAFMGRRDSPDVDVVAAPVASDPILEESADELDPEGFDEESGPPVAAIDRQVSERFTTPPSGRELAFRPKSKAPEAGSDTPVRSTEGVRLLATQMAVAGSSREDIEARLQREFGIEDASDLVDSVLTPGPGSRSVAG